VHGHTDTSLVVERRPPAVHTRSDANHSVALPWALRDRPLERDRSLPVYSMASCDPASTPRQAQ